MRKNGKRELAKAVMAKLKAQTPDFELHHIFGRTGRLAACARFIVGLTPGDHRGEGYGARLEKIRDEQRWAWLAMQKANYRNRDQTTCWWEECDRRKDCPLYEEAP
jgi:hypothetical protein